MKRVMINWNLLVQKESLRIEWKENVADERGVIKTLCAFANDIQQVGGGRVICGLKEGENDFGEPAAIVVGLDEKRFKQLKNKVLSICHRHVEPPLTPIVEEYPVENKPGRKLLAFSVTSSQYAHRYRIKKEGAQYYVRINDRTQPANGLIEKLLEQKKKWPPYLEQTHPDATIDDIDWFALKEFFGRLELPLALTNYLEPGVQFRGDVHSLVTFPPGGSRLHVPRNFSLLLFGKEPHRFFSGAFAIFSVYQGIDKTASRSQRYEIFGPIPVLIRNIMDRLQLYMGIEIDKTVDMLNGRQNRLRYSTAAVQEAVVNAFVHRDYHSHEPVRITVFFDRIEIANPGGLYDGISIEQLSQGKVQPSWRNPSLAWFMVGLDFAQNEGRGIAIIISETEKIANKTPGFEVIGNWFVLAIPAYSPQVDFVREDGPVYVADTLPGHDISFVGRQKELKKIEECLHSLCEREKKGPVPGLFLIISGAGGVGKTTLALETAKRFSGYFPDGVLPLVGVNEYTPVSYALHLSRFFNLQAAEPADDRAAQALITAILKERRVLLILDNAVAWQDLRYMLPVESACRIILTTRSRDLHKHIRLKYPQLKVEKISLEKFTPEEALSLFHAMLDSDHKKEEEGIYLQIAEDLGFLPIALRQAISLMLFGPHYSGEELRDKLTKEDRLDLLRKGLAAEDSDARPVEAVFDLSTPLLTGELIEVLKYLAVCAPGPTPASFLARLSGDRDIGERLERLFSLSYCERHETEGGRSYELHRLVRELVNRRFDNPFRKEFIDLVHNLFTDESVHFTTKDALIPQLEEAFALMKEQKDERLKNWLSDLSDFCTSHGCEDFFIRLTEAVEKEIKNVKGER